MGSECLDLVRQKWTSADLRLGKIARDPLWAQLLRAMELLAGSSGFQGDQGFGTVCLF